MKDSTRRDGLLVVLVIATIGTLLALQGWKSRLPQFDALVDIDNAHELIIHKQIPDKGVLTSLGSHSSPGAAWLMLPGVLIFRDPRLFEHIGSIAVYLGTLIGVFLLAGTYFGRQCAILSVALYGLSELGLQVAGSLWQRYPTHLFYIWMVYFAVHWVRQKEATYLAAAVTTWALGMYVFMEMAPALFILPVIWIYYRPPVRIQPLLLGAILTGVVWYPYLHFEVSRGFVDLKSQVFRKNILPASFEQSWCEPDLAPRSWHPTFADLNPEASEASNSAVGSWRKIRSFVLDRGHFVLVALNISRKSLLLLFFTMLALTLLTVQAFSGSKDDGIDGHVRWANRLQWLSIGMILSGLVINEFTIAHYLALDRILDPPTVSTVRKLQALVIVAGIALMILRHAIASGLNPLTRDRYSQDGNHSDEARVLLISLIVPFVILIYLTEEIAPYRLWWLWPVQIVILASIVTYWPMKLRAPRLLIWIGSSMLIVLAASNTLLLSRLDSWIIDGWSGTDPEQIRVIDYAARQIKSDGKDHAAIGYDLFIRSWWAIFNVADHRYKIGADLDLFFEYRYGIVNTNRCAEGVSTEDTYRIVQGRVITSEERAHIDIPSDDRFHVSQTFESFQLLQRPPDGP